MGRISFDLNWPEPSRKETRHYNTTWWEIKTRSCLSQLWFLTDYKTQKLHFFIYGWLILSREGVVMELPAFKEECLVTKDTTWVMTNLFHKFYMFLPCHSTRFLWCYVSFDNNYFRFLGVTIWYFNGAGCIEGDLLCCCIVITTTCSSTL